MQNPLKSRGTRLPVKLLFFTMRRPDDHQNPWHHSPATRGFFVATLLFMVGPSFSQEYSVRIYFFASQEVAFFVVLAMFIARLYDCPRAGRKSRATVICLHFSAWNLFDG